MKKILFGISALLFCFSAFAVSPALEQLKQSPSMICHDHPQQQQCLAAVEATILAVYNITSLNENCQSSSDEVKAKMSSDVKEQCAAAKEIADYLKSKNK